MDNATYILIVWILTDSVLKQNVIVKYFKIFSDVDEDYFTGTQNFFKNGKYNSFSKKSIFAIVNLVFT